MGEPKQPHGGPRGREQKLHPTALTELPTCNDQHCLARHVSAKPPKLMPRGREASHPCRALPNCKINDSVCFKLLNTGVVCLAGRDSWDRPPKEESPYLTPQLPLTLPCFITSHRHLKPCLGEQVSKIKIRTDMIHNLLQAGSTPAQASISMHFLALTGIKDKAGFPKTSWPRHQAQNNAHAENTSHKWLFHKF